MSCNGYVSLPAFKVRDACNAYLQRREDRILREREPIIQSFSQPRFFGLLRPRTREEAIRAAKADGFISDYDEIWMRGRYYAVRVEEVLHMAKVAVDNRVEFVQVSSEVLESIGNDLMKKGNQ
jgi:hypothetical protein